MLSSIELVSDDVFSATSDFALLRLGKTLSISGSWRNSSILCVEIYRNLELKYLLRRIE